MPVANYNKDQKIAICVPTYLRPKLLKQCLLAAGKIKIPQNFRAQIIVADNDPEGTALDVCEKIKGSVEFEITHVIESERGLSSVRNRLLKVAVNKNVDYIAFIDDDEFPTENWLTEHIKAITNHQADVSSGPVIQVDAENTILTPLLKKSTQEGIEPRYISTNNVVFNIKLVNVWNLKFDDFYNFIGGEDFDFFQRAKNQGAKQVWAPNALVYETWIESRKTLRYLMFRHFTGGINNVLRYKKHKGSASAWLHFIPKSLGKLFGSIFYIIKACLHSRMSAIQLANGIGYLFGLCDIVIERYKTIDGE